MKVHHIGIACDDIESKIVEIRKVHSVSYCSDIIFDENQNANVCLLKIKESLPMELVSGEPVKNLLNRGMTYYHLGYSVGDIAEESIRLIQAGSIQVTKSKPALLFNNNLVAFFYGPYGLIELVQG